MSASGTTKSGPQSDNSSPPGTAPAAGAASGHGFVDNEGPAVRFFLARALSPRVQVNARWIGVNARHRKAHSISGKEPGCPLLGMIASGSESPELKRASDVLGLDEKLPHNDYLTWFRTLNADYPFLDYSRAETKSVDSELMGAYAASEPAPPLATPWRGQRRSLSEGRLEPSDAPQTSCEDLLAAWLRLTAGVTHTARLENSVAAFRTSPSGGARHPTDIAVRIGQSWGGGLAGDWWYDGLSNELVTATPSPFANENTESPDDIVFFITSHVRRAMWRYRDARAIRPVIIDAGHIVETLIALIQAAGWTAWSAPTPGFAHSGDDLDPIFYAVYATREKTAPTRQSAVHFNSVANDAASFGVTPFISLVPCSNGISAQNHLSGNRLESVTPGMIDALAWATPSSRGDRPTNPNELLDRFVNEAELLSLIDAGLLVEEADSASLWERARAWFNHDWYLSMLAHSEEIANVGDAPVPSLEPAFYGHINSWGRTLDQRRTSRAFNPGAPGPETAARILSTLKSEQSDLLILLTAYVQFADLSPGVYEITSDGAGLTDLPLPNATQIRDAAIGQPWARNFGAIVWLTPNSAADRNDWESNYLSCGRVAQRLALLVSAATDVGIFQTPALVDDSMPHLIGDYASVHGGYMVGFGEIVPTDADGPSRAEHRFSPSSLIAEKIAKT